MMAVAAAFSQTNLDDNPKNKKKALLFLLLTGELNYSSFLGADDSNGGSILGFGLGIKTRVFPINNNWAVDAGLGYSQMGGESKTYEYVPGGEYGSRNITTRLGYVVVPVTAVYETKKGFYAEAGLRPGLLLSAKTKSSSTSTNVKSDFKSLDVNAVVGAGYQFKNKIGVNAHYYPGITSINESGYGKIRNNTFSAGVSYKF